MRSKDFGVCSMFGYSKLAKKLLRREGAKKFLCTPHATKNISTFLNRLMLSHEPEGRMLMILTCCMVDDKSNQGNIYNKAEKLGLLDICFLSAWTIFGYIIAYWTTLPEQQYITFAARNFYHPKNNSKKSINNHVRLVSRSTLLCVK